MLPITLSTVYKSIMVNSSFKLTLHMELLTDSKPFSNFKTFLSAKNSPFVQYCAKKITLVCLYL